MHLNTLKRIELHFKMILLFINSNLLYFNSIIRNKTFSFLLLLLLLLNNLTLNMMILRKILK